MASFRSFVGSELMSIKQHIAGLRNMLPQNIRLKPTERRSMFKLNDKKREFVEKAVQNMRKNPNTVPSYVDVTVCNNYVQLYKQYSELLEELQEVQTRMEDAKLLLGNEILKQTRAYFHNSRTAAISGNEPFDRIYNELKPHYAVGRNSRREVK
ncbi:MAG: hypothetical protein GXC72_02795 [Chitinophagaceae bacterium]|nr:hypothetical protein [Chitinophagaceae bacterium]